MTDAPLVKTDAESTAVHHPVWKSCIVRADRELVFRCQRAGAKPYRGLPLGSLSAFYPHADLKGTLVSQGKEFIRHMELRGLEPQGTAYTLELWGPYRDRLDLAKADRLINIEEGNPFFPDGRWVSAARTAAPAQRGPLDLELDDMERGVHFIVRGLFHRKYGKESEETGQLIF